MNQYSEWETWDIDIDQTDVLLNLKYETLVNKLKNISESQLKKQLENIELKKKLIDSTERKYDFLSMIRDSSLYLLKYYLFDDIGIELLKDTPDRQDKIQAMICLEDDIVSKFFEKDSFCELVISNHYFTTYLKYLDIKSSKYLYDYIIKQNNKYDYDFIEHLSEEALCYILRKETVPIEIVKSLIKIGDKKTVEEILKNDYRISSINDLNFENLYKLAENNVEIPYQLFNETNFIKKLATMSSIKEYRFLINNFEKFNDVEYLEKQRRKQTDKIIENYNTDFEMFDNYYNCYKELENALLSNQHVQYDIEEILDKHFNFFGNNQMRQYYRINIRESISNRDIKSLKEFFSRESKLELSNMFVDYHFQDIFTNVLKNIKELYNYQLNGEKILSNEDLEIYKKLLNLDNMSYQEILQFHKQLKEIDFVSKFYDDYRATKNNQVESIRKSILNEESIRQFENKDLSKKYDVPVYYLDGEPFYALVKSMSVSKNNVYTSGRTGITTDKKFISAGDGSSFSLTSSDKLKTISDPKTEYHFIFSDFDISQVVHTFENDSFTYYKRDAYNPSVYINRLYTPEQLVKSGIGYNEILMSTINNDRNDELNEKLKDIKVLGLYCYDEICENDILTAKKYNIPIVLINTQKYKDFRSENQTSIGQEEDRYIQEHYEDINEKRR